MSVKALSRVNVNIFVEKVRQEAVCDTPSSLVGDPWKVALIDLMASHNSELKDIINRLMK